MCGIIGYTGTKNSKDVILDGLKNLEYRGYDSSGIGIFENNSINIYKSQGKITNLEEGLVIGAYGIREPKKDISNKINPKDIDIVIVPAVAFDRQCYRLGYGGGFYDRFIKTLRKDCITIGIAFDLQIFDSIPKAPHDAQLDYIITEKRILTSSK